DQMAPIRHATLIDFGLAYSDRLSGSSRDQPVGSARYVAPEQAGLLEYGVTESSDLYSVGLLLYECLSGESPFDGNSINEILRQQLTVVPRSLRAAGLDVPRGLDELIQRLIQKDPRRRYQSTEGVLHDVKAIS